MNLLVFPALPVHVEGLRLTGSQLGHVSIPEPIAMALRMSPSDWLRWSPMSSLERKSERKEPSRKEGAAAVTDAGGRVRRPRAWTRSGKVGPRSSTQLGGGTPWSWPVGS